MRATPIGAGYTFPSNASAASTAAEGDYDGDGIANALERITGHNPLVRDFNGVLPEVANGFLYLTFRRSITVDPAEAFVESSLNLQLWSASGITYTDLGPAVGFTDWIEAAIPLNGATKKFGRVRYAP